MAQSVVLYICERRWGPKRRGPRGNLSGYPLSLLSTGLVGGR